MKPITYSFTTERVARVTESGRTKKIKEVFALDDEKMSSRTVLQNIVLAVKGIVYITGFSGSGKSTLVRMILQHHPQAVVPRPPVDENTPIINLLGENFQEAIQVLGWVGLGEAFLYLTPYAALSEGQKARFQIAYALAQQPSMLVIDEFLSNLDRITARVVAYSLQKVCRKLGIPVVVATAHHDLTEPLGPDVLLTLDLNGAYQLTEQPVDKPRIPELHDLQVEPGTLEDYLELKRFHYFGDAEFAEDPEYVPEIYAMRFQGKCIGVCVLLATYPESWEEVDYFREINERVKTIIRVVVHPAFRGAGLAKKLVRPALSNVPYIETRSALGLYMPIYEAAGFQRVELPSNQITDKRLELREYLQTVGVTHEDTVSQSFRWDELIYGRSEEEQQQLREMAMALYLETILGNYRYLREIAELPPLSSEEQAELEEILADACSELPVDFLLTETVYFPMQGFAVRHAL